MYKSLKHTRNYGKKTRKSRKGVQDQHFEQEITVVFLETLLMIKLFHWKTHSYATHKATDEFYTKFNDNMDRFIEVLLGKTNSRINLMNKHHINLFDFNNVDGLTLIIFSSSLNKSINNNGPTIILSV